FGDGPVAKPAQPWSAGPIPLTEHFDRHAPGSALEAVDTRIANRIDPGKIELAYAAVAQVSNQAPEGRIRCVQFPSSRRSRGQDEAGFIASDHTAHHTNQFAARVVAAVKHQVWFQAAEHLVNFNFGQ